MVSGLQAQLRKLKRQAEQQQKQALAVEGRLLDRQHFLEAQVKELKTNLANAQDKVMHGVSGEVGEERE